MPSSEQRAVNWAGHLSQDARAASEWYHDALVADGSLPPADRHAWYAPALPDPEEARMPHTVTFVKGEHSDPPVIFDCEPGQDPVPFVRLGRERHYLQDGDRITVDGGRAVAVESGPERE